MDHIYIYMYTYILLYDTVILYNIIIYHDITSHLFLLIFILFFDIFHLDFMYLKPPNRFLPLVKAPRVNLQPQVDIQMGG